MSNAVSNFERYRSVLIDIISKRLPRCRVYLFGSRARGTHQSGSDIDLALDCGEVIDLTVLLKMYNDIDETTIPLSVDLVDIYAASDVLKRIIQKEGIIWKS